MMFGLIKPEYYSEKLKCVEATWKLIKTLKLSISFLAVKEKLEQHPDYPSLLSVADCLDGFNVNTLGLKLAYEKLGTLPTPFISLHENNQSEYYNVVYSIKDEQINIWDNNLYKDITISRETFTKEWTGKLLLVEATPISQEPIADYNQNILKQRKRKWTISLAILLAMVFFISPLITFDWNGNVYGIVYPLYYFLKIFGLIISTLLLWFEIDNHNPFLQQICTGAGEKSSCNSVLASKSAKLLGIISWSEIGFAYFFSGIHTFIIYGLGGAHQIFLSALSIVGLVYIPYSLYVQYKVIKKWCPLCLVVQAILLFEGIIGIYLLTLNPESLSNSLFNNGTTLLSLVILFIAPLVIWSIISETIKKAKESKFATSALSRIKNDPAIFNALLEKQEELGELPKSLGVLIGDENARHRIVKICNPHCGPCAKMHVKLEKLLEQVKDVSVQIIFNTPLNIKDRRYLPTKHLLAIANSSKSNHSLHQALDDWYTAPIKQYEDFAKKYPIEFFEDEKLDSGIKTMSDWCSQNKIIATPTVFIDGYKLPKNYSIDELAYILKD
ncbi:MAG: vitamin K epoxide reductase family protein [Sediminibacterium sp.]|uniref:vitamin K epoxide reductase family protein n=1 Tax=Sediminibacterium sp. TaxID=1917865 RepID=UPI00271DF75D|nr:vitamin K epoxide reductase family protein [Sediminibacterium sp.]MDO8997844.1 vitamin K epoxide reductase family protein [Sediminibacterium sp.]